MHEYRIPTPWQSVRGNSNLGNTWIGQFNSPANQMVYRSMAAPCLGLDRPARSLGGAQWLRCACSSMLAGVIFHERQPRRYGRNQFVIWLVLEVRPSLQHDPACRIPSLRFCGECGNSIRWDLEDLKTYYLQSPIYDCRRSDRNLFHAERIHNLVKI